MAKQLRLDVAQLTDVGRKREHNEDNMAYVIPKDPQVMTKKGALFIVADGMGGHAAGEVASEIAVDTVSNVYYQDDRDDVADAILHAIRRANAAIHQRAAENMLRTGMGTTCVAAILRGNRAYIANVGDSRAYLIRNTQVKQVSQDHSWVAEQVRAGLLTEDQARTHAQRNVITRCLGTQAEVEIDVFSEELEAGDSMVLCTDGLSGLVGDDELQKIVNQFAPQESVYHLVERANENGGPDNITAIVVHVQEIGVEPPNVRHPVRVGGRETSEDTQVLGLLPESQGTIAARNGEARSTTAPLRISSGPLASPESATAPLPPLPGSVPVAQESAPRRSRLFYPTLALLVLLVVALVGGGVYYLLGGNQNVAQLLKQAQTQIDQAKGELSTNPGDALQHLATAQEALRDVPKNHQLSNAQNQQMSTLLATLKGDVRTAIDAYNASPNAAIKVVPCSGTTAKIINEVSTSTHAQSIASVVGADKTTWLYALGLDDNVYWLKGGASYSLQSSSLPASTHVLALAGDQTLLVGVQQQANQSSPYSLTLYQPEVSGNLKATNPVPIDPLFTKDGKMPLLLSIWQQNVYVVLVNPSAPNNALLLNYSVSNGKLSTPPRSLQVSSNIRGIAALPNQLFLLLADGSIASLHLTTSGQLPTAGQPLTVLVQQPIVPPLATSDRSFTTDRPFTTDMTVPVPQQAQASQFLTIAGATALSAGMVNGMEHLYVSDPGNHRLIDLVIAQRAPTSSSTPPSTTPAPTSTTAAANVTVQLFQQEVSTSLLGQAKSMAVDPQAMFVSVLIQNSPATSSSFSLLSLATGPQTRCVMQSS